LELKRRNLLPVILDKFRCTAKDLTDRCLRDSQMWLRLDGDTDDVNTWHPIKVVSDQGFRTDTSQPFVEALTVSFADETPDVIFNEDDAVEFAVPRPAQ
jgi:hypothetical protein